MSGLSKLEERVASDVFKAEVRRWAAQIGVEPKEIHVRPMTRKWASASSAGRLTFDTDLINEPHDKRAEIIVHELVHLKVGNHGSLFRNLVRAYLGNGKELWGAPSTTPEPASPHPEAEAPLDD
jgi:predicted metal-dependent hydrolase